MEYYLRKVYQGFKAKKELFFMVALIPVLMVSVLASYVEPMLGLALTCAYLACVLGYYLLTSREFIFLLTIVCTENIFYIFNRSKLRFVYDLKQLVGLMMMMLFIVYLPKIIKTDFLFKKGMLAVMGYHIFAIFVAHFSVGQSLKAGLYMLLLPSLLLAYFFFCFLIEDVKSFERFKVLYILITGFAGTIYSLQSLLYPNIIFMMTDFRQRIGNVRFTEFIVFMNFGIFMTLNMLLSEQLEKHTLKRRLYVVVLIIQCGTFFLICQSRYQSVIATLLIIVTMFFLQKQQSKLVWLMLMLIGGSAIVCVLVIMHLMGSAIGGNIVTDTINEVRDLSGSLGIRLAGGNYYTQNLKDHWLFGWGNLNNINNTARIASGKKFGYYLVDTGVVGYIYQYGIIGTLISLGLIFRATSVSLRIYLRDKKVFYPLLCCLTVLLNGTMVYYYQEIVALLYLGLLFAFIEFEYKRGEIYEE